MKVMVTGAAGQLGREITDLYCSDTQFIAVSRDGLDITDLAACYALVEEHNPDFIINTAAYTAVDAAETNRDTARRVNVDGVSNLAKAAGNAHLVHISTDFVFDGTHHRPYKESHKASPLGVYGKTKFYGEALVKVHAKKWTIIRTSWLYSTYGKNFVKTILRLAGDGRDSLKVISDQVGTPTYAGDLAETLLAILPDLPTKGLFHYSNEGVASWYDFAKSIVAHGKLFGMISDKFQVLPQSTEDYPTPAPRPHYSVLDKSAIKECFDIVIPHWEESLSHCFSKLVATGSAQD